MWTDIPAKRTKLCRTKLQLFSLQKVTLERKKKKKKNDKDRVNKRLLLTTSSSIGRNREVGLIEVKSGFSQQTQLASLTNGCCEYHKF